MKIYPFDPELINIGLSMNEAILLKEIMRDCVLGYLLPPSLGTQATTAVPLLRSMWRTLERRMGQVR